jgi:hypothetical protein
MKSTALRQSSTKGCIAFLSLLLFVVQAVQAEPGDQPPKYTGTFQGEDVSLELHPNAETPGSYSGSVRKGDQKYPLTGYEQADGGLAGNFRSGDDAFTFTARLSGEELTFSTDDNSCKLKRFSPKPKKLDPLAATGKAKPAPNPLAKDARAAQPASPEKKKEQPPTALPDTANWVVHPLAGGSGTIKFPPGWKLTSSDDLGSCMIDGPAKQAVVLGSFASVITPNSSFAQMAAPGGAKTLIAPFCAPAEALKHIFPQLSTFSQSRGGPAITLERIISSTPLPAAPPAQAACIDLLLSHSLGGETVRFRELVIMECHPGSSDAWSIYSRYGIAPDKTYEQDLPVMLAIAKSWQINEQQVNANGQRKNEAQQQWFAAQQAGHAQQNAAFDRQLRSMQQNSAAFENNLRSMQNNSRVMDRVNADYDETIRGTRTVENTGTGQRTDVNLGTSTETVQKANEAAGFEKYKEVPLRNQ